MRCWTMWAVLWVLVLGVVEKASADEALHMQLRTRAETHSGSQVYAPQWRDETWDATKTAVIICDMWDAHHCYNAVQRVQELAPRMNEVVKRAREAGALIIHAPSNCMAPYKDLPGRRRAQQAPTAENLPADIGEWCHQIPAEEQGTYPVDQTDGGEDDDPDEHEAWHAKLRGMGLNPKEPWTHQIDVIEMHDQDAITDSGVETWNLLEARGIENVAVVGVHTNMCVLGRPFGLRQLAKNGKNVVLVRDMTDTMYNPAMWPYVNHHTGTDRIVEHIEKYVCPTVLSTDFLGGKQFRFTSDSRPRVAVVVSEFEYETYKTVPQFAEQQLGNDFKVDYIINDDEENHDLPGLAAVLADSDVLLLSMWRRTLPPEELNAVRKFVAAGKAIVAIRTSSHAFATRDGSCPKGRAVWPEFDIEVLGGFYQGHHGNYADKGDLSTSVWVPNSATAHPLLTGVQPSKFATKSWLYKMAPIADGASLLLQGRVGTDGDQQPVAWTTSSPAGGRVFYTSLGHPDDFQLPQFSRLLTNAVYWAAKLDVPAQSAKTASR